MYILISSISLFIFIGTVIYYDIKFNKIYNKLNILFILFALSANSLFYGLGGTYTSILGMIAGFLLLILPFLWGWVGGGDVKFLAAVGTLLGPLNITISTIYGLILFGITSFFYLCINKRLVILFKQILFTIFAKVNMIEITQKLPMGVFLGIGIIIQWFVCYFFT